MNETALLEQSEKAQAKINKAKVSYDPFEFDNFEEAIRNLHPFDLKMYLSMCVIAESISQDTNQAYVLTQQARCHRFLMSCIKAWWKHAELSNPHPSLEGDC